MTDGAGIEKEVKRRSDIVEIFPNESSIIRLIGAVLLEANDKWQTQHRYMQIEPDDRALDAHHQHRVFADRNRRRMTGCYLS